MKIQLFNLLKIQNLAFIVLVLVLSVGFSFLSPSKSFACYDDDGYYYNCDNVDPCADGSCNTPSPTYVTCDDGSYATSYANCPSTFSYQDPDLYYCSYTNSWVTDMGLCNTSPNPTTPQQPTYQAPVYTAPTWSSSNNTSWSASLSWNTGYQCWNGSTVNYSWQCPSQNTPCTTNCSNPPAPITCPAGTELLNNKCVKKCTTSTGDWFYVDVTQQCPNTPTPPTPPAPCPSGATLINNICMRQCPDGTWKALTDSCPVQPPIYVCPNGQTVTYASQCPPPTPTCPSGATLINNVCTRQCPDGTWKAITESCPVPPIYVCPNGQTVTYASQCPAPTQTCWNGQVIPTTQSCPPQYQTCWNNQTILVTQQCPPKPVICTSCSTPVIQNHSVVTNMATQVSQTSAQCNGIGLIANNVSSVGWFEYGETTSLGRNTNSGNIGSAASSPFSAPITGLKPNTTYYCRAVIANANGTYRGQIVSFRTLPVPVPTPITPKPQPITYVGKGGDKGGSSSATVIKKAKTEFVCADGSLATAKTVSIADTVNAGGKLMQVNVDKDAPDLVKGSTVNYKLTIKNTADTALTGTEVRFVLPAELTFDKNNLANATIQNNILIITETGFNAGEAKTYIIPVKVAADASVGKTIVTTGYVSYYLPVVGTKLVKDEVSAYMIANIADKVASTGNVNANLAGAAVAGSFVDTVFPQSLLSWLILFAIILIIVVLVMNIHSWMAMRKKEKEEHVIHHHIA